MRSSRVLIRNGTVFLILFSLFTAASFASPITYIFKGTVTGSFVDAEDPIESTLFTSLPMQVTITGDTSNVYFSPAGGLNPFVDVWVNATGLAGTVSIDSILNGTFQDPLYVGYAPLAPPPFDAVTPIVLFGIAGPVDLLDFYLTDLGPGYALKTAVGPVPAADGITSNFNGISILVPEGTETETYLLTLTDFQDGSFQALGGEPVPEPSTILLLGVGLAGLVGLKLRK